MTENGKKNGPVRTLTVKNFSVIKEAKLEFGKITVLIGPQASGKSLLCKLAYFFQKVVIEIAEECIREDIKFEGFCVEIARRFSFEWFPFFGAEPVSKLTYTDGSYSVVLDRSAPLVTSGSTNTHKFALPSLSTEIQDAYEITSLRLREERDSSGDLDRSRYARVIRERLESLQTPEAAIYSYIPSTRAFFTSPQKALIGVSQRLDPFTIRFSQDFSLDFEKRVPQVGLKGELASWINREFREVLQGEIRVSENSEIFETKDGRNVPLSFLSSGTQELLPLATCLREFTALSVAVAQTLDQKHALHRRLFFVEEPEANIFPSTQNELVKIIARMAKEPVLDTSWVITTHSPYILSAFNNLIEASQVVAAKPALKDEVTKLIPENYWIKSDDMRAYSIHDGNLESIMDEETGLISANYLDSASETIGVEFDELLRLGYVES
jgi:predicted ATP-dependent endonuclease of OLD family